MQIIASERRKEMRRLINTLPTPAMELSGADHRGDVVTDEAIMQPNAATPVEPFSLVRASLPKEPPPALSDFGYGHPPLLPRDAQRPYEGPPPPPGSLLYPPPAPASVTDNQVSLPPIMFINESTQPPAYVLLPPGPKSDVNMSSRTLVGFVVGTSTIVSGVFFVLVLIIFCVRHLVKKNHGHFEDCPSSAPKDNYYAKVPDNLNQKMPAVGVRFNPAPEKLFSVPPDIRNDGSSSFIDSESESHFSPLEHVVGLGLSAGNFTYAELARATNGFASANLLGEGGFGYVDKGVLPSGREIAVKQLKMGSHQGEREFQAEIETISRVHHKHLVSLVGYCITRFKRLLVYEFVCNGSLEFHLHEKQGIAGKQQPVMNWATRMKIAIGSAKGLAYLQEDCNPTIIHRDIKAANILLDSKYEAKVSDFGLAKFFRDSNHHISHISTRVVGTIGYLAPEYAQSGKVSEKSDVYSYGVMLLELITGYQPIVEMESTMSLASWARQVLETGNSAALVDPCLQGNYDAKEMDIMVSCAAACVRYSSWRRPGMSQIVRALEGDASVLDLDEGIKPGQSSRIIDYHIGEHSMSNLIFAGGQYAVDRSVDNTSKYNLHMSACSINKGEKYYFKHRKDDQEKQKVNLSI